MSRLTTFTNAESHERDCVDTFEGMALVSYEDCLYRAQCKDCPANIYTFIPAQLEKLNE